MFHSEDPNIFMTGEQRCWTCFVYCPVTARGPEVLQIDTITPPVSYTPLLFSYGVVACQLDNGQVARHEVDIVQVHDPDSDEYDAEAHTRCDWYSKHALSCIDVASGLVFVHHHQGNLQHTVLLDWRILCTCRFMQARPVTAWHLRVRGT